MPTGHLTKRQQEALDLRIAGKSYPKIAQAMGITQKRAYELVSNALAHAKNNSEEKLEEVLRIELERLDEMQDTVVQILINTDEGEMKLKAVDRLNRIQERRSKLLGLETTKSEVKVDAPWAQFLADVVVEGDSAEVPEATG